MENMTVSVFDYNSVITKVELLQDQLKQKEDLIDQYQQEVKADGNNIEDVVSERVAEYIEELEEKDDEIERLNEECCDLEDTIEEERGKRKTLKTDLNNSLLEWKKINSELKEAKKTITSLEKKLDKVKLTRSLTRKSPTRKSPGRK